ncbi:hypothetical protein PR048_021867 [Dryococelus australis]|uniref:Uncharacterized protein n=1 Tax=Dryococelus australis TaxID=614101 RepID=A0ABQ9GZE4_9NEOP|nr:hypothetical protein PR048_021867 [Dryococelus australis]
MNKIRVDAATSPVAHGSLLSSSFLLYYACKDTVKKKERVKEEGFLTRCYFCDITKDWGNSITNRLSNPAQATWESQWGQRISAKVGREREVWRSEQQWAKVSVGDGPERSAGSERRSGLWKSLTDGTEHERMQRVYKFVFSLFRALSDKLRRPEGVLGDVIHERATTREHSRGHVIMTSQRTLSGRLINYSESVRKSESPERERERGRESRGGVVVNYSPPTYANRARFPAGPLPGFSLVGIVPDDVVGRWIFSGISRFPRLFIQSLLRTHFSSLSFSLKTTMVRVSRDVESFLIGPSQREMYGDGYVRSSFTAYQIQSPAANKVGTFQSDYNCSGV